MAIVRFPIMPRPGNICTFCLSAVTHLSPGTLALIFGHFFSHSQSLCSQSRVTWLRGALDLGLGQKIYQISLAYSTLFNLIIVEGLLLRWLKQSFPLFSDVQKPGRQDPESTACLRTESTESRDSENQTWWAEPLYLVVSKANLHVGFTLCKPVHFGGGGVDSLTTKINQKETHVTSSQCL